MQPGRHPPARTALVFKRALDVLVAAGCLVLLAPVLGVAAIAVRVTLGAPVLFRQSRPGRHGKPFTLYKLRTMRAPEKGEDALATDGARLTRLGRLLRSSSIDELPTLWNVLEGDMSLVGPRPLLLRYLPRYSPRQATRHEVKPGVTGWAQVNGRNAISWDEKLELDAWYVEHWSLGLDLRILVLTVATVLRREGVRSAGHETMPEFTGSVQGRNRP